MKLLKKIVLVIAVLSVLAVGAAFLLPSEWKVERSQTIDAPPAAVFAHVNNLKNWSAWTPWNKDLDETLEISYEGPEEGVGAAQTWKGDAIGEGKMTITASEPGQRVDYDFELAQGAMQAKGWFLFESDGKGTTVTWGSSGDLGWNPVARYMGLALDGMIGADYEKGLKRLKDTSESSSTSAPKAGEKTGAAPIGKTGSD